MDDQKWVYRRLITDGALAILKIKLLQPNHLKLYDCQVIYDDNHIIYDDNHNCNDDNHIAQDDNQVRHGDSQRTHHDSHTVMMKTTSNRMTARADMVKAGTHIMTAITLTMKT